ARFYKATCANIRQSRKEVNEAVARLITVERVAVAHDHPEWINKAGSAKSTNLLDDIVKLTSLGKRASGGRQKEGEARSYRMVLDTFLSWRTFLDVHGREERNPHHASLQLTGCSEH